jgi:hypothetical protein
MNALNLVVILRNIRTSLWVSFCLKKGKKCNSEHVSFLLCPDNLTLLVKLDDELIKEVHDVDIKSLNSIFGVLNRNKYTSLKGFKLQKVIFESKNKEESRVFSLVTIPMSSELIS